MASKAEEILDRHVADLNDWTSGFKGDILEVLKEVASIAFDAGYERFKWEETAGRNVPEPVDKTKFIDNLFNNE